MKRVVFYIGVFITMMTMLHAQSSPRRIIDFNKDWRFSLDSTDAASRPDFDDSNWRLLQLPHDWSIEYDFSKSYPATNQGGALPGGTGWYRKTFALPDVANKIVSVEFDGVHQHSDVWINGHHLGHWAFGYTSFRYELTKYLKPAPARNVIVVKVDNSKQPNSRWYTGSGIYRDVKLVVTNKLAFEPHGVFVWTDLVSGDANDSHEGKKLKRGESIGFINVSAAIGTQTGKREKIKLVHALYNQAGKKIGSLSQEATVDTQGVTVRPDRGFSVTQPSLWSPEHPYLYKVVSTIYQNGKAVDEVVTMTGIRKIHFDSEKGFFLNNQYTFIKGVCMHHDLGALGAAFNNEAARRQLRILKEMGCNAIRTAHNPPAAAFLDLCDEMGFLVMDEAFDMWRKRKNRYDYHLDFKEWYKKDLEAMVLRDRNHPSVFTWSIGNEIREQFDSSGIQLTKDMVAIVKKLDPTRPVTSALTETVPEKNFIYQSKALDLLGFNYKLFDYDSLPSRFPGEKIIAAETVSALATRGAYDLPSDSIRIWPPDAKQSFTGNADMTVSAYDHAYAYWGATHEQTLKAIKRHPFIAGCFVWSGFDFIGEPVPYPWPARSSYYGIVDLAGFPKDVYYMYQSDWTDKPVLHIFPHWNWTPGQVVDVWAYYSQSDEVELFLNGQSLGKRQKEGDSMHVVWQVPYAPGILKAVSTKNGKVVMSKEIHTAGKPARIELIPDKKTLKANGKDLAFVTVRVVDKDGNVVPDADNLVKFSISGQGIIAGTDNGFQADTISLKRPVRNVWKGMALVIVQSAEKKGNVTLRADSAGLLPAVLSLKTSE